MADNLKYLIDNLKKVKIISSNPGLINTLTSINQYSENDFSKAYFLGLFFKNKFDSVNLSPVEKNKLIDTIKENNLSSYFYLKTKPANNRLEIIVYVFIFGGLPL